MKLANNNYKRSSMTRTNLPLIILLLLAQIKSLNASVLPFGGDVGAHRCRKENHRWYQRKTILSSWTCPRRDETFSPSEEIEEEEFYGYVDDAWIKSEKDSSTVMDFDGKGNTRDTISARRQGLSRSVRKVERNKSIILASNTQIKMWPPWPLSLLSGRGSPSFGSKDGSTGETKHGSSDDARVLASKTYPSVAALFWASFTQKTRIGIRQLKEVGSSLWFHLPPVIPPILLVASIPRKVAGDMGPGAVESMAAEVVTDAGRMVVPLFSNAFVRTMVLSGIGMSVLSWAHAELHRKRNLTPLPLSLPYQQGVSKVFLPPFLPDLVPEPEIQALEQTAAKKAKGRRAEDDKVNEYDDEDNQILSLLSPRLQKNLSDLYESTQLIGGGNRRDGEEGGLARRRRQFLQEWKRRREARKREAAKVRRLAIFDELVALQAIKRKAAAKAPAGKVVGEAPLGYALITGASQGIGRAIAVELARWEIPLVLVARDLDRLTALAYDLEACYGVKCCVMQADLSQPDSAESIYEATHRAGISVDILVNNAGIAYEGLSTDITTDRVERMIMINTMSYAKLGKLYGQDMVESGRGRILMVSSMAGVTSSSPNTALYGATKAFEKSLALSMAKEMEPYGVGVTCLMPGPVSSTAFRSRSGTGEALCWYIPYYARPAETVAHLGVMSLLDGDSQVIPGWQNRAFVQLVRPIIPQRVEAMTVETAWTPFRLSRFGFGNNLGKLKNSNRHGNGHHEDKKLEDTTPPESVHLDLKPRYKYQQPPRVLLKLEDRVEPVKKSVIPQGNHTSEEVTNEGNESTEKQADASTEHCHANRVVTTEDSPKSEMMPKESMEPQPETANRVSVSPHNDQRREVSTKEGQPLAGYQKGEKRAKFTPQKASSSSLSTEGARQKAGEIQDEEPRWLLNDDPGWISPRLGPINLLEQRNYELPNAESILSKWTIIT